MILHTDLRAVLSLSVVADATMITSVTTPPPPVSATEATSADSARTSVPTAVADTGSETATAAALVAARIRVADQIRQISHALIGHEQDTDVLEGLADDLAGRLSDLTAGPPTNRSVEDWADERQHTVPPADGEPFPAQLDRPVSGRANPRAVPLAVHRVGDRAVATVTLESAHEGAPDRSHGGVVAAIFDDLCGYVLTLEQTMAYTAWLRVEYRQGTPIHEPITFSSWLERRDGRKLTIRGECTQGDTVLTTCEALFIAVVPST